MRGKNRSERNVRCSVKENKRSEPERNKIEYILQMETIKTWKEQIKGIWNNQDG